MQGQPLLIVSTLLFEFEVPCMYYSRKDGANFLHTCSTLVKFIYVQGKTEAEVKGNGQYCLLQEPGMLCQALGLPSTTLVVQMRKQRPGGTK